MNKFWRIVLYPFLRLLREDSHNRPYSAHLSPWRHHLIIMIAVSASLSACAAPEGGPAPVYNALLEQNDKNLGAHMVAEGDTPQKIAANYGVSIDDILRANGLSDAAQVKAGQRLYMPDTHGNLTGLGQVQTFTQRAGNGNTGMTMVEAAPLTPAPASEGVIKSESLAPLSGNTTVAQAAPQQNLTTASAQPQTMTVETVSPAPVQEPVKVASALPPEQWTDPVSSGFRWPVKGPTLSGYGEKSDGLRNDGINIGAMEGSAVEAAADGEIVYTGQAVDGFGNLVLMKHKNNFVTAYGHLSRIDVQKGQTVKAGQIIGGVGKSGSVSAPQLHFEIRQGGKIMNPSNYLNKNVIGTQTAGL